MTIQQAYTDWSATYDLDRNLTRDLDEVVTQDALTHLRCQSILEIGCGTGKNTARLAQIGKKVHAVDFSEGMIHRAKDKLHLVNVTFSVADLTAPWPCQELSVDLIACNLVLEHIQGLPFVFSEAKRCLVERGRFFICELHPYRQYQGVRANFQRERETTHIPAFVHHISDFMDTANHTGLILESFKEWWHAEDQNQLPRLVSFMFEKPK